MGHDVYEAMGAGVIVYICRFRRRSHRFFFDKWPAQRDGRNEACLGVFGPHLVRVLSDVFRGVECLILCLDRVFGW